MYFSTKNITVFFILFACFVSCQFETKQKIEDETFHNHYLNGDFVFVSADSSSFGDAIANVTSNENQCDFSHVGLVHVTDSGIFIIEAIPDGVVYTPIEDFVERNKSAIIRSARLKDEFQQYIPQAIRTAYSHVGKEYDFSFDLANDAYYCSELLYLAFVAASGDSLFFDTPPMTFKTADSDDFYPFWISYFQDLGIDIPEGQPGLNPNGMSLAEKLYWIDCTSNRQ